MKHGNKKEQEKAADKLVFLIRKKFKEIDQAQSPQSRGGHIRALQRLFGQFHFCNVTDILGSPDDSILTGFQTLGSKHPKTLNGEIRRLIVFSFNKNGTAILRPAEVKSTVKNRLLKKEITGSRVKVLRHLVKLMKKYGAYKKEQPETIVPFFSLSNMPDSFFT